MSTQNDSHTNLPSKRRRSKRILSFDAQGTRPSKKFVVVDRADPKEKKVDSEKDEGLRGSTRSIRTFNQTGGLGRGYYMVSSDFMKKFKLTTNST